MIIYSMINKAIIFILVSLLVSCSFESLIISNLDFFLTNQIAKSLSINYYEKKTLNKEVQVLLNDNKAIATSLKNHLLKMDLKKVNVKQEMFFLGDVYFKIAKQINPIISKRIAGFEDSKYMSFIEVLKEENREIISKNKEKDIDYYAKKFEFFFGELNNDQKNMVSKIIPLFGKLQNQRLKDRIKVQNQMKEIRLLKSITERENALVSLFNKASDRTTLSDHLIELSNFLQNFLNFLTNEQVSYFKTKKNKYVEWTSKFIETNY